MNLRQLEHVTALAETRNFHRAADALGITQPALTLSVRNLEDELGVPLFERSKRDVTPTAFGMAVIRTARDTLAQLGSLRDELELMQNLQTGRLVLACNAWAGEGLVGPALSRMLRRYPSLRFTVLKGEFETLADRVDTSRINVYVGLPPEVRDNRFVWHDIVLPRLVMLCRADHPILDISKPAAIDCMRYPIGSAILSSWYIDRLVKQMGDPRTPDGQDARQHLVTSDDLGVIRQLARTTDLMIALPEPMAEAECADQRIRRFDIPEFDFPLSFVICHSASRPLPPAGVVLVDEIKAGGGIG